MDGYERNYELVDAGDIMINHSFGLNPSLFGHQWWLKSKYILEGPLVTPWRRPPITTHLPVTRFFPRFPGTGYLNHGKRSMTSDRLYGNVLVSSPVFVTHDFPKCVIL